MPLQDYQRDWLIQQQGLDPSKYTLDANEENIIPKPTKDQPSLGNTPYEAKVYPNPGFTLEKSGNQNSALSSFAKAGAEGIPAAVGGGIGAAVTSPLAAAATPFAVGLAPETFGASLLIPPAIQFGGALLGGMGADALRQQVEPEEWQQNVAQAKADNPWSAKAGQLTSMLAGGLRPSPGNAMSAGRGLVNTFSGQGATAEELANLANVGIGAGMGAAQPAFDYIRGKGSLGAIAEGAATGGLFNKVSKFGERAYGFHPSETVNPEFTRDMIERQKRPARQVKPKSTEDVSATPGPDVMENWKESGTVPSDELNRMEGEGGGVTREDADAAEQNRALKAQVEFFKAQQKAAEAAQPSDAPTESNGALFSASHDAVIEGLRKDGQREAAEQLEALKAKVLKGEPLEPNDQGTLKQWNEIAQRPEFKRATPAAPVEAPTEVEEAPTEKVTAPTKKQRGFLDSLGYTTDEINALSSKEAADTIKQHTDLPKNSPESPLATDEDKPYEPTPQAKITAKNLEMEGLSGKLTQRWLDFAQKLGLHRNVKLEQDGSIVDSENNPVAGQTYGRQGLKQVIAKLNPKMAALDTPVHEEFHSYINDLRKSPRAKDNILVAKYDALVRSSKDFQDWIKANKMPNNLESIEEFQASNAGVESVNRAMAQDTKWQRWGKDFSAYAKTRFGEHGTLEDFQRIMHYKMLHDPSFENVFGEGGKGLSSTAGVAGGSVKNQEESGLNETKSDFEQYQEAQAAIKAAMKAGDYEALGKAFKLNEDIKNRHGGMPPTADEVKNQGESPLSDENKPKDMGQALGDLVIGPKKNIKEYQRLMALQDRAMAIAEHADNTQHPANDAIQQILAEHPTTVPEFEDKLNRIINTYQVTKNSPASNLFKQSSKEFSDIMEERKRIFDDVNYKLNQNGYQQLDTSDTAHMHNVFTQPEYWASMEHTIGKTEWDNLRKQYDEFVDRYNTGKKSFNISKELLRPTTDFAKNQAKSNLVSPKHSSVVDLIDKAKVLTDNAQLDPKDADEIQSILTKSVDWPKDSKVGAALKGKDFDNMDPEHWVHLNSLYNAEQFQYEDKNQEARATKKASPKKNVQAKAEAPAQVQAQQEVPPAKVAPTPPEVAQLKARQEENSPTESIETTVPVKPEKKQVGEKVAKVQGMPALEETLFKGPKSEVPDRSDISNKEQKKRLKDVKASWDWVDTASTPDQAGYIINELHKQYQEVLAKKRTAASKDEYDYYTGRQQTLLAQMYHLESKWDVEMPPEDQLPKYSKKSNLGTPLNEDRTPLDDTKKSEDVYINSIIKGFDESQRVRGGTSSDEQRDAAYAPARLVDDLNNPAYNAERRQNQSNSPLASPEGNDEPNWKVSPLKDDLKEQGLPYSTFKLTRTLLDKIIKENGEPGQAFSDAYHKYASDKEGMYGKYMAPILKAAKGLSVGDWNKVENIRRIQSREGVDLTERLTAPQLKLHDAIQESMEAWQNDQKAANQPVSVRTAKGQYVKQALEVDHTFHPDRPSPKVVDILTSKPNSPEAKRLKNDFLQFRQEMGDTPELAKERLNKMLKAYDLGESNHARFRDVRSNDRTQLPDSWMRDGNLMKNMDNFFNRVASDRSFHDNFETNPDVAQSIGLTRDPWGKKYNEGTDEEDHVGELQGSDAVHSAFEKIYGEPFDKDESNVKLANRIATSLFLGPLTNIHIAASSVAKALEFVHPGEALPAIGHSIANIVDGYEKALTQGYAKKNLTKFSDILDINNTAHERLSALASGISKINGRDATNAFTKGFLQNMGDWVIKSKMVAAEAGDKGAISLMKQVNPDWEPGSEFSQPEIDKMASNFAGIIHGTHDPRTLPGWMLKDTAIQPFFQLMSWNVAQTNAWMRHVWTPAKNGNLMPFLMSTVGSIGGGYLINQLREMIGDKKGPIPSIQEIINSSKGIEGNIPLDLYKAASLASYVGYAGILSVAAKDVGDIAFKNIAPSAAFPLDEVMSSSVHRPLMAISAMLNDPNIKSMDDYVRVVSKLATDLVKENIQFGRIATSWLANNPELMPNENYYKNLNAKESQLRRFKMVEGLPYEAQTAPSSNPYMDLGIKQFKHNQNVGEAAGQARDLVQNAIESSNGNPDVMRAKLHKLKANVYETMPDPQTQPRLFKQYRDFLVQSIGPEETNSMIQDYFMHKALNHAKAAMIPTLGQ